jgi:hypothetical protein
MDKYFDKYRDRFEGGIFSSQGLLGLKSGEVFCKSVQINDLHDGNSLSKPFIDLLTEYDLGWNYLFPKKLKHKIDFFRRDYDHIRNEVWDLAKKTRNESWFIVTKEPFKNIKKLLPLDWGFDDYPNVWIMIVNDKLSMKDELKLIKGNVRYLTSDESIESVGKLLSSQENPTTNSCMWIISGLYRPKIRHEIDLCLE